MKDLNHKGKKITVLREFGDTEFLVCQGDNFYSGLFEMYREFNDYSDALDYFNHIAIESEE